MFLFDLLCSKMTSYLWILLLASLVAIRAQDLDLSDALFDDDDKPPTKPPVKPVPPKNPSSDGFDLSDVLNTDDPKKPAVVSPPKAEDPKKPSGGDLDLTDAFGPDTDPKKPVVEPPKDSGTGGGSFDDTDLFGLGDGGGQYKPDGGQSGGHGQDQGPDPGSEGSSDQPQGGALAAIISSVGVALLGAASSYFAYQKKKLCFKGQAEQDPESGKNQRGTASDNQIFSNLLRSS